MEGNLFLCQEVKWRRGPQGGTLGLEYLSQSNDISDNLNQEDRFKFVDDLTTLKIVNLLITQVTLYDFFSHVASNIPIHIGYIKNQNFSLKSI